jgi:TIR domain
VNDYRPTLAVHVVWHPRCEAGADYGQALFGQLFEDPRDLAAHGLRIPVRLWRSTSDADEPPPPAVPPLEEADHAALVILIDEEMIAGPGWQTFLETAADAVRPGDALLGVSLTDGVAELQVPRLLERNLIHLEDVDPALRPLVLVNRVMHALHRLLTGKGVSVFLSHAKLDGLPVTDRVRDFLLSGTGVKNFFDAQDLPPGSRWADLISDAAADHVLLAIRTDAYATREWCRAEVLEAKVSGSPVVVLDALESFEPRGFPYLGNTPAVRWLEDGSDAALENLLRVILQEALRFRYFPTRIADLCDAYGVADDPRVLPAPPELLTILHALRAAPEGRLVYPDPPLGTDELQIVRDFAPHLEPVTPNGLIASR